MDQSPPHKRLRDDDGPGQGHEYRYRLWFSQPYALRKFVHIVASFLPEADFCVRNTAEFEGLAVERLSTDRAVMGVGQMNCDVRHPPRDAAVPPRFSICLKDLETALSSVPLGGAVELSQRADSDSLFVRYWEPGKFMQEGTFHLSLVERGLDNAPSLANFVSPFSVDVARDPLATFMNTCAKFGIENMTVSVRSLRRAPVQYSCVTFDGRSALHQHRKSFVSVTHEDQLVPGSMCVHTTPPVDAPLPADAEQAVAQLQDAAPDYEEEFHLSSLHGLVAALAERTVVLMLTPGKPLLLKVEFGHDDSWLYYVQAPLVHDEP